MTAVKRENSLSTNISRFMCSCRLPILALLWLSISFFSLFCFQLFIFIRAWTWYSQLTAKLMLWAPEQLIQNSWHRSLWWFQSLRSGKACPFAAMVRYIHSLDGEWAKNIHKKRKMFVKNLRARESRAETYRFRFCSIADVHFWMVDDTCRCRLNVNRVNFVGR